MTTQQNSSITTNSNTDLDNFIVTVEDNQDVIIIDTCKNRIGVNTIDPSYSIDVRSRQDVSGTIYTSYLKTGNIISSLIPHTDNTDMSLNLGSTNKSWNRIDASYIEISGITVRDANQFTIGEGSGGAGIVFPSDISINGDMCCNNIVVDGITINDANKFSIGEATNGSGITFPLDISINGNLTVTGTVHSTYLEALIQDQETGLQYQYDDFKTDKKIIAYNIDVSNINIKENILFNGISAKQDETIVYDGSKVLWKTKGENLVNYVENNTINNAFKLIKTFYGAQANARLNICDINSDGNVVVFGYPDYNSGTVSNTGLVRVFAYSSTSETWDQIGNDISGTETDSYFGKLVRIAKDSTINQIRIAVADNNNGVSVYDMNLSGSLNTHSPMRPTKALSNGGNSSIKAIDISHDGNRIVASEYGTSGSEQYPNVGFISAYDYANDSWTETNIVDHNSYSHLRAGASLAISGDGNRLIFGLPAWNESQTWPGAIAVYDYNTSNEWSLKQFEGYTHATDEQHANAGWSTAISSDGTKIAFSVGAKVYGLDFAGHVELWELNTTTQKFVREIIFNGTNLTSSNTTEANTRLGGTTYGIALSSDGNRIAIGSGAYDDNNYSNNGILYIKSKSLTNDSWDISSDNFAYGIPGDSEDNARFGSSVAMTPDGTHVIASASLDDNDVGTDAGLAKLYKLPKALENNTIFYANDDYKLIYFNPPTRQPPTITLLGDVNMTLSNSQVYTEPGAVATDYRGIQIVADISGTVDVTNSNTYTIDYSATDREGRTSQTITRTVIVS